MRQREIVVANTEAGEVARQIGQLTGDEMHDLALAPDTALHGDHTRSRDDAALAFKTDPGDASLVLVVMTKTALADPRF